MHTKGPWIIFRDDGLPHAILPAGRPGEICNFKDGYRDNDNARLIAAAPDLLAACKTALDYLSFFSDADSQIIKAAIAKTEGRWE